MTQLLSGKLRLFYFHWSKIALIHNVTEGFVIPNDHLGFYQVSAQFLRKKLRHIFLMIFVEEVQKIKCDNDPNSSNRNFILLIRIFTF